MPSYLRYHKMEPGRHICIHATFTNIYSNRFSNFAFALETPQSNSRNLIKTSFKKTNNLFDIFKTAYLREKNLSIRKLLETDLRYSYHKPICQNEKKSVKIGVTNRVHRGRFLSKNQNYK